MQHTGLDGVTVTFPNAGRRRTMVLDDITLSADPGEILAVLGPSGSGKSTLLRAVAGLVPVDRGEVYVNGRRVTGMPAEQRRVAMVFETSTLLPFLNVAENLRWGLRARAVPEVEAGARVEEQVRRLRLGGLLGRRPRTLSAGELGAVGIGRALVHQPSAFLFDEPLSHLDAGRRWQMRHRIAEVVRAAGVSTLYVTHDHIEALGIADRVALINHGRLVQVDTPRVLYERPGTLFAAGFVGTPTIGLLSARPVAGIGAAAGSGADSSAGAGSGAAVGAGAGAGANGGFRAGPRTLPLWAPLPAVLATRTDREVVLGFRPEAVHEAGAGSDPSAVTLPATVIHVEDTGPDRLVTLEVAAPAVTAPGADPWSVRRTHDGGAARLVARFDRNANVPVGAGTTIALDVRRAHVFDAETGNALWHPEPDL